jgi:hypothetical protein
MANGIKFTVYFMKDFFYIFNAMLLSRIYFPAIVISSLTPSTSNELSAEVEGVKLDLTIAGKEIRDNKYSIKNIEESLDNVVGKFDTISQQHGIFGT